MRYVACAIVWLMLMMPCQAQLPGSILTVEPSSAKTVTGTSAATSDFTPRAGALNLQLDVTAAATEAGDTLDVFVQTTLDGTNWIDVAHFTQVVGNGGAKRHFMKIAATEPQAAFENATALAAGSVRNIVGTRWRCRWVIVDVATTTNQSFTFSVVAGY